MLRESNGELHHWRHGTECEHLEHASWYVFKEQCPPNRHDDFDRPNHDDRLHPEPSTTKSPWVTAPTKFRSPSTLTEKVSSHFSSLFAVAWTTWGNFNDEANNGDGSCEYVEIEGACDCFGTLPAFARDCDGNCILDADGDGICDDLDECHPGLAQSDELQYRLSVEEWSLVSWARLIAFTSMPRMTQINFHWRCLATTIGLFRSTPLTASTIFHSTVHLGTPQASTRCCCPFFLIWRRTVMPLFGLKVTSGPGVWKMSLVQERVRGVQQ